MKTNMFENSTKKQLHFGSGSHFGCRSNIVVPNFKKKPLSNNSDVFEHENIAHGENILFAEYFFH